MKRTCRIRWPGCAGTTSIAKRLLLDGPRAAFAQACIHRYRSIGNSVIRRSFNCKLDVVCQTGGRLHVEGDSIHQRPSGE